MESPDSRAGSRRSAPVALLQDGSPASQLGGEEVSRATRGPTTRSCGLLLPSTAACLLGHPHSLLLDHPLTQGVRLPILVWDSEHAYDLIAFLPQVAINFLAKQALPDHCDLHGSRGGWEEPGEGIRWQH